ncbi:hypothetical protein [Roseobacter weihaiensis]|uniref:hypothetical protein n=1 Tax=Roseobacter weihaiensis TaxID=2763262 RepID=UPI001D0A52D3|nr:hypothetical protein [Roseobacter sp. H9]
MSKQTTRNEICQQASMTAPRSAMCVSLAGRLADRFDELEDYKDCRAFLKLEAKKVIARADHSAGAALSTEAIADIRCDMTDEPVMGCTGCFTQQVRLGLFVHHGEVAWRRHTLMN